MFIAPGVYRTVLCDLLLCIPRFDGSLTESGSRTGITMQGQSRKPSEYLHIANVCVGLLMKLRRKLHLYCAGLAQQSDISDIRVLKNMENPSSGTSS